VGRNRGGWCMTWQTRVGVVDVVGGWGHGRRGWALMTWVVDDVADAEGRRGRRGWLGRWRAQMRSEAGERGGGAWSAGVTT